MSFIASSRPWRLAALALALAVSLAGGCVPGDPGPGQSPGSITVIAGPAGTSLNPYTTVLSSRQVGALLFRGLFGVDDQGMPVPDLATEIPTVDNGGISADRTEVTYRLDPDARWADGEPLTAGDVVFTWGLLDAGVLADDPRGAENVVAVTAIDEHTVRLTLSEPDAPFAWRFVPYVLPRHLLEGSPDVLSDDFWVHPVGSRGRLVERHIKGSQVDLIDPAGQLLTIRVVFAQTDAAARSVWEAEVNCVWLSPPVGPAGSEQESSVPSARWRAFIMNPSEGHVTADLAVREAFSAAATVTVAPGDPGPYGYPIAESVADTEAVLAALDDAGWRAGADGVRSGRGRELVYDVIFNPISAEEGNRIEYDIPIRDFGGRIEPYPTFPYTDYPGGSPLVLGDFDVALLEFPIGVPYGWAWPYESGDVPSATNPAGLNVSRVSDAGLDAAATAMQEAGSPAELRSALGEGWARLEELRLVKWDLRFDQTVLYKGVEGVEAEPFEEYALRDADSWRIAGAGAGE